MHTYISIQLSVFNCRLESNICALFIENSWKFRIKKSKLHLFLVTYLGLHSLALPVFGSFRYLTLDILGSDWSTKC